jgi:hypothetical protein
MTERTRSIDGRRLAASAAEQRLGALLELLELRHPESYAEFNALRDAATSCIAEAQEFGAQHQARVIRAALSGRLTALPGCAPQWEEEGEEEFSIRMGS